MALDQDFSHYAKHGDGVRRLGNNFYQDLDSIDYRDFEQLQNSHTLYLIITPPMDLSDFGSKARLGDPGEGGGRDGGDYADAENQANLNKQLEYYSRQLISGHLMRCSSLLEGVEGLRSDTLKVEKTIENTIGKGLSIGRASSRSDETEMTLSFNETKDLDVYNTFSTIMAYQKAVIDGHRNPIREYVYNGILDYVFQLYAINFDRTGQRVLSTVKLSNITLVEVTVGLLESNLNASEHKKTVISVRVQDFTYNDYGIFDELEDYGVLPASKYKFNTRRKALEYVRSSEESQKMATSKHGDKNDLNGTNSTLDFLADAGRTLFPNTGGSLDDIIKNGGYGSNINTMQSVESLASGLFSTDNY